MSTPARAQGSFLSIEKAVAFVVGPVVAAGAGWLSTFLATRLGVNISQEAIVGIYGTGQLTAFGLAYKWLHGKQVEMQVQGAIAKVEPLAASMGIAPAVQEGFVHVALADLEHLAEHAAATAVGAIHQVQVKQPEVKQEAQPPPVPPIPPAANDPAPATPVQPADAGAAPAV